jgi:hypothetical protein
MKIVVRLYDNVPIFCEYLGDNQFQCWDCETGFYEMSLCELKEETTECDRSIYYEWLDEFKEMAEVDNVKIIKLSTIERNKRAGIL